MARASQVDQVLVSQPSNDTVEIEFHCKGKRSRFRMTRAEAISLEACLPQRNSAEAMKSLPEALPSVMANLPSVLSLPLVTEPIASASSADYPDGLIVEMRMDSHYGSGALQRLRLHMFADTARILIRILQDRLAKIGETNPPAEKPRGS